MVWCGLGNTKRKWSKTTHAKAQADTRELEKPFTMENINKISGNT